MPPNVLHSLDEPFQLSDDQINFFTENGFIKLKDVFSVAMINYMKDAVNEAVDNLNTGQAPMEQRDTYGKAFLQIMNIWTSSSPVKEIVFGKRLAKIAADLLEVTGVRLYHDQALYKEPGGGHTPWHADQYYWPLATDKTVTAWIPLQETPLEMGALEFSAKSNKITTGRNLEISDDSQQSIEQSLKKAGREHVIEPFEIGEVSFHSGWLFHRAGPNNTTEMRSVMTIIYMDKDMRLKEPENPNQLNDWNTWCPGAVPGEIIETAVNPIIFQK